MNKSRRQDLAAKFMSKLVEDREFRNKIALADRLRRFYILQKDGLSQEEIIKLDDDLVGISETIRRVGDC